MERFLDEVSRNLFSSLSTKEFELYTHHTIMDNIPVMYVGLHVRGKDINTYMSMRDCEETIKSIGREDGLDEITNLLFTGLANQFFFIQAPADVFAFSNLSDAIYRELWKELRECF